MTPTSTAPRDEYEQREARQGREKLLAMSERRLGLGHPIDARQLDQWLDSPLQAIADRVRWVLDGNYGSGYYEMIRADLARLPATQGRRTQAIKRIAITAFLVSALSDHPTLNRYKITALVKASGRMSAINSELAAMVDAHIAERDENT